MIKRRLFNFLFILTSFCFSQEITTVKGAIINANNNTPLENVNIVNLTQVIGTSTNKKGEFSIDVKANDTLHFSY